MGRHSLESSRRRRRRIVVGTLTGVVIVALAGGAGIASAGGLFESKAEPCIEPVTLEVVADWSIAPVVSAVAAEFTEQTDDCVAVHVRTEASAATATVLASATERADVWIPESDVWIDRAEAIADSIGRPTPDLTLDIIIATSPIVFAVPAAHAAEFDDEATGWSALLASTIHAVVPDPNASSVSLAALLELQRHARAGGDGGYTAALDTLSSSIPPSTEAAINSVIVAEDPTVAVTTEQAVARHNRNDRSNPLVALYPAEGTVSVAYPYVRLPGDGTNGEVVLADQFQVALLGAREALVAAGFRAGDGSGTLEQRGVLSEPPRTKVAGDGYAQLKVLQDWSDARTRRDDNDAASA